MNKIIHTKNYLETAKTAIQYQYRFTNCNEVIKANETLLYLSNFTHSKSLRSSKPTYPLCISFKLSLLSNMEFPHQHIMNTVNNFPYKLKHVKKHTDIYGVHYIILFT